MCKPSNRETLFVYFPSSSTVSIAFIPLFKQRLKSSGPWLGAQWTIPVPCSVVTKRASNIGIS